jgi:hypothetical protein
VDVDLSILRSARVLPSRLCHATPTSRLSALDIFRSARLVAQRERQAYMGCERILRNCTNLSSINYKTAYAFGGLLAFGTFQIHGGSLANWRCLCALEGSLTICMAIVAFIFLQYSAAHAKSLTEDEKKSALYRMQVDSSSVDNELFVIRDAIAILKEPASWVILAIEVCMGVPLRSVALFLPQTIAILSYATVKTSLDAPDYVPALATTALFGGLGIVLTLGLGAFMMFDNRRRDRKQGLGIHTHAWTGCLLR